MKCESCQAKLEVYRACRKVCMRCTGCKKEYQIHEIASRLDQETEEILARYPTIIYD